MINPIRRSVSAPRRRGLTTEQLWLGDDRGLIACWEVGRELAEKEPELADRAKRGELPILGWKGGVDKPLKSGQKYGTYRYLAMWQGLRNDDLDMDTGVETRLTCSRTGVIVTYTSDAEKYGAP